jgi:two-component system, OmpR family, sensor histidine kinase ChvG
MTTRRSSRWRRLLPGTSRIAARLFAFNLLLLFLPIAAILYLDVYETQLLEFQERGMSQQGRILAAALADSPLLDELSAAQVLGRLGERGEARFRIYDARAALLADSNRITSEGERTPARSYAAPPPEDVRARVLYRLGAWIVRVRASAVDWARRILTRRHETIRTAETSGVPYEVSVALRGRYGAATRQTPGQRSLTLNTAVPIRQGSAIIGAVLVSQTTFRVLQALYEIRLRIFEVVIGSILSAALLTTLAAATVVRPMRRLRDEAAALAGRRHRLPGEFQEAGRRDELGDLARALQELTRRLDEHIREAERFASDVSHEFKNPLASIRAAAETALQSEDSAERARFMVMLMRDVDRLEGLVSGVRELTRIDAQLEQEPVQPVNVEALLSEVIDGLRLAHGDRPEVRLAVEGHGGFVRASPDRLVQAFENVLANARSFAPPITVVDVSLMSSDGGCRIEVSDQGPGIPDGHLDRVFDRFFTYRPDDVTDRGQHAGLGLSIARTIVQGYGGTIAARNRAGGGSVFEIRLPLTQAGRESSDRGSSDRG